MYWIKRRYTIDGKKFNYVIDTDELDPFNDGLQLYAKVDNGNCLVTDDGFTSYNFQCLGQTLNTDSNDDIVVKGKWSDLDHLVKEEVKLIKQAYDRLRLTGEHDEKRKM